MNAHENDHANEDGNEVFSVAVLGFDGENDVEVILPE